MTYTLHCAGIQSPAALHRALAELLRFPDWYGNNLDALHDCLCAISEETELILEDFLGLGPFSRGFARVLADAAQKNPLLTICLS